MARKSDLSENNAPQQRKPYDEDTLIIRFYDLSDLFSVAPQYPAKISQDILEGPGLVFANPSGGSMRGGGGFGGGGGGVFNFAPSHPTQQQAETMSLSAARVSVDSLIEAIQYTVAPDQWDTTDGEARISVLGNTLLISATESMHEQISNLLNLIREHWGKLKTVSVTAYWIRSTAKEVGQLVASDQDNRMVGKVDQTKWTTFFESSIGTNSIAYSATISGHNGQTLNTVAGQKKYVVVGAETIYTESGMREINDKESELERVEKSVAGLYPIQNTIQLGAALQISPLCTRGGNFVILDVHTRVTEKSKADPDATELAAKARSKTGEEFSVPLSKLDYNTYQLSTTIRCPKDQVVLAGGMTYREESNPDTPNLYLFVKTKIHTIEEDNPD